MAGILSGLAVTLSYMVVTYANPELALFGITHYAAGIFGVPVNFVVALLVSYITPPPSVETQAMVDAIRHP